MGPAAFQVQGLPSHRTVACRAPATIQSSSFASSYPQLNLDSPLPRPLLRESDTNTHLDHTLGSILKPLRVATSTRRDDASHEDAVEGRENGRHQPFECVKNRPLLHGWIRPLPYWDATKLMICAEVIKSYVVGAKRSE